MAGSNTAKAPEDAGTVAFDPRLVRQYILGNITLGEMEGIDKETQYKLAERGFALMEEGQLEQAEEVMKGLIALDPYDSYFHTVLGSIHQRSQRLDDAVEEYSRALQTNPFNTAALANRGEIRFNQGKLAEASDDLRKAIESDPKGEEAAGIRARMLAQAVGRALEAQPKK